MGLGVGQLQLVPVSVSLSANSLARFLVLPNLTIISLYSNILKEKLITNFSKKLQVIKFAINFNIK